MDGIIMETKIFEIDGKKQIYYRKRRLILPGVSRGKVYYITSRLDLNFPDVFRDEKLIIWLSQKVINDIMEWAKWKMN